MKKFAVEWAEVARRDLYAIVDDLVDRSPGAALRVLEEIEERAASLETLPARGRWVPELERLLHSRNYRELLVKSYRIVYRIDSAIVFVLGAFDGRRDLEDVLVQRVFRVLTESE